MSKKDYILNWIKEVSKNRPELGGFSVCPYAKSSSYDIVECDVKEIRPVDGYDVIIYIIDDLLNLKDVQKWVEYYNKLHQSWLFFEDCASYDTYIQDVQTNNGKYNLILAQPKEKLRKFREKLSQTNYYSYWDQDYLKEILDSDISIIDSK